MGYPELWKRAAFAAKVEAVAGTPETLVWATHAIRGVGALLPEEGYLAENTREDAITGGLGTPPPAEPAARFWRQPLRFPLMGAGSAYAYATEDSNTLPECHPLLRAAGLSLNVAGAIATYSLSDDPVTAITAYLETAGKKVVLTYGVIEALRLIFRAGANPMVEGTLIGIHSAITEQALEVATYDTFTAAPWPVLKGTGSLIIGSYQPQFQEVEINLGTSYEPNLNGNAADGHGGGRIVSRNPLAIVRGRVPAIASWDPRADKLVRTPRTLDLVCGAVQYKRVKVDVDAAVVLDAQFRQDGSFMNYEVTYQLTAATAEANIVFD